MWYLAGTFNADGSALPVVADQRTPSFVRDTGDELFGAPTNLSASLDGVAINVPAYLVESDPTSFTPPADNIYGIPGPQPLNPHADKAATSRSGSTRSASCSAAIGGQTLDVTYNLKVGLPG